MTAPEDGDGPESPSDRGTESESDAGSSPDTGSSPDDESSEPSRSDDRVESRSSVSAVSDSDASNADSPRTDESTPTPDSEERSPSGAVGWLRWFLTVKSGPAVYLRDIVTSIAVVALVGAVLFGISGLWPPMVAVESGSMEPNMERGDLVFIVDNDRFTPGEAPIYDGRSTGVVPADVAADNSYDKFNAPGDVIVFTPDGNVAQTPIIHRAMLWIEDGENWYDRADRRYIDGAENCDELEHCPAPYSGFITLGDNNGAYDQVGPQSAPVRPEWVVGTAELRIPYLGHVRLLFSTIGGVSADEPSPDGTLDTADSTDSEAPTAEPHRPRPSANDRTQPAAIGHSQTTLVAA